MASVYCEKIGANGFAEIGAEGVPVVGLGEDVVSQALGAVAAVGFLGYFDDEFGHRFYIGTRREGAGFHSRMLELREKPRTSLADIPKR
jgi:hypothetical protein